MAPDGRALITRDDERVVVAADWLPASGSQLRKRRGDPYSLASIVYTSGTTGRPKGALRNHRHDVLNMMTSAIEQGIKRDDRALLLFPFYHVTFADSLRHILMANTIVLELRKAD